MASYQHHIIKAGKTSVSLNVFVPQSNVTTGNGLTGLVFNTASLTAYWLVPGGSPAAITLATLAAVNSAWSSGGFKELDATNMPGHYRLDIPDAVLATGPTVTIHLRGAANMTSAIIEIDLVAYDPTDTVRLGLTALPNAAAAATGGLQGTTFQTAIADALLNRDMSAATDTNGRTPLKALRKLMNRVKINAGVMTVYKEDDSTSSFTQNVTTTAGNPISELDTV